MSLLIIALCLIGFFIGFANIPAGILTIFFAMLLSRALFE